MLITLLHLTVETKAQAAVTDTVKHRLEQLDDFEEVCVCVCRYGDAVHFIVT